MACNNLQQTTTVMLIDIACDPDFEFLLGLNKVPYVLLQVLNKDYRLNNQQDNISYKYVICSVRVERAPEEKVK